MLDLHDFIVNELFEKKSVSALIWLIEQGREAEIKIDGTKIFISKHISAGKVSLCQNKKEQTFESVEELIEKAVINNKMFLETWDSAIVETLF